MQLVCRKRSKLDSIQSTLRMETSLKAWFTRVKQAQEQTQAQAQE